MPSAPSRSESFEGESYTSDVAGHEEQEEQLDAGEEDDPNYKVDEDGTEWWQDDEGAWWYRDSGMEDWLVWVDGSTPGSLDLRPPTAAGTARHSSPMSALRWAMEA